MIPFSWSDFLTYTAIAISDHPLWFLLVGLGLLLAVFARVMSPFMLADRTAAKRRAAVDAEIEQMRQEDATRARLAPVVRMSDRRVS